MKQLSNGEALHKLAAYCSTAERCKQDIEKKLIAWKIPDTEHMQIINRLQQERFLDEERFCRAFVNDKTTFSKWGRNKICYELRKKNIPETLIQQSIGDINPTENNSILLEILRHKKKTTKGKTEYDIKQKLMRFAAGRGFTLSEINRCMKKLFEDFEDIDY